MRSLYEELVELSNEGSRSAGQLKLQSDKNCPYYTGYSHRRSAFDLIMRTKV